MSTPPHPPQKSLVSDSKTKDRAKQDIGYFRVLGIQKDKSGTGSQPVGFSKYDKMPSPSFNPMNLFSGEKKEDRVTRVKLNYYKQLLQADLKLAEKAFTNHVGRYESLQVEFAEQKSQLNRWGLESLMKSFRMQSWLRQSRGELLMVMTKHIIKTLQKKLSEVTELLAFLNNKNSKAKSSISSDTGTDIRKSLDLISDSFYASPEALLEKDREFLKKRQRLSAIDKLCHSASATFRESLPELNSKDFAERSRIVGSIVKRYGNMLDSKNLCMNSDIAVNGSWHEFSVWYQQKCTKELQIYDDFLQFIDDEREREGRLFRRWCNLVRGSTMDDDEEGSLGQGTSSPDKSTMNSTIASTTDIAGVKGKPNHNDGTIATSIPNGDSGGVNGNDGVEKPGEMEANATYMVYPKCVQIFIRYFAINIIATTYEIPKNLHSALLALVETVIHRAVRQSLLRYPSDELRKKDKAWRMHALKCRYVDPIHYHSAPKHLGIAADTVDRSAPRPVSSLELHLDKILTTGTRSSSSEESVNDSTDNNRNLSSSSAPESTVSRSSSPPTAIALHSLREEEETGDTEKVTPTKLNSSSVMTTPQSAMSTSSYNSMITDYSLTPPPPSPSPSPPPLPPSSKPGNFTQTPPSTKDPKKKGGHRSSSTGAISSSSTRTKFSRSRSASISGLTSLGGKTVYCESILKNFAIICPLYKRMETLLANSLDKLVRDTSTDGQDEPNSCIIKSEAESYTCSSLSKFDGLQPCPNLMVNLTPSVLQILKSTASLEDKISSPQQDSAIKNSARSELVKGTVALYALPARVMGMLQMSVSPRDAVVIILLAVQWLTRTAYELLEVAGRKKEALGADDMFPLLVNVLAHANIPCIHLILHYLHTYIAMESFGEAAYYVTSMGAAVEFIDTTYGVEGDGDLSSDEEGVDDDKGKGTDDYMKEILDLEGAKAKEKEVDEAAVNHLGEWLRDQQVMEDTMVVMMQEGWMG